MKFKNICLWEKKVKLCKSNISFLLLAVAAMRETRNDRIWNAGDLPKLWVPFCSGPLWQGHNILQGLQCCSLVWSLYSVHVGFHRALILMSKYLIFVISTDCELVWMELWHISRKKCSFFVQFKDPIFPSHHFVEPIPFSSQTWLV